jgi:ABC-type nitrate/sulfonate/bicarbonate transport system permease component
MVAGAQQNTAPEPSGMRRVLRAAPRRHSSQWWAPWLVAIAAAALVQLLVAGGAISETAIPRPTAMISSFVDELGDGAFWTAVLRSMQSWAIGLLLAAVLAVPIGAAAGLSWFTARSLQFLVDFLRPIPPVALLPLLILLLGVTDSVKVALAALGAFFPLYFATLYGIQDLDPVTDETARSYRLGRRLRLQTIVLPGSMPYVATGFRVSATIALLLVIGTEMVIGVPGLGRSIVDAQLADNPPVMYARVLAAGLLGVLVMVVFRTAERRVLRWHPSQQGAAQ